MEGSAATFFNKAMLSSGMILPSYLLLLVCRRGIWANKGLATSWLCLARSTLIIPSLVTATLDSYPLWAAAIQRFSAAQPRLTNNSRWFGSTTGSDLVKSGIMSISPSAILNNHGCVLWPDGALTACAIINR